MRIFNRILFILCLPLSLLTLLAALPAPASASSTSDDESQSTDLEKIAANLTRYPIQLPRGHYVGATGLQIASNNTRDGICVLAPMVATAPATPTPYDSNEGKTHVVLWFRSSSDARPYAGSIVGYDVGNGKQKAFNMEIPPEVLSR